MWLTMLSHWKFILKRRQCELSEWHTRLIEIYGSSPRSLFSDLWNGFSAANNNDNKVKLQWR